MNSVCLFVHLQLDIENEVNNEMANRMSLFYAEATPMLKTLSNATTNFVTVVRALTLHHCQQDDTANLYHTVIYHAVTLTALLDVCIFGYIFKM